MARSLLVLLCIRPRPKAEALWGPPHRPSKADVHAGPSFNTPPKNKQQTPIMTSNYDPSIASSDRTLVPSLTSSKPLDASKSFPFPRDYHFPPFFTRQPTLTTRHAQLQKWSSLILSYSRYHKIWKLALADAIETDLFWNKKLGKKLSREDVREVVEFMRKEGRAEWVGGSAKDKDGTGSVFWVWWRNPEEWAGLIADWVSVVELEIRMEY